MKTLLTLAKELDFKQEHEYYDYIMSSYINGQRTQCLFLFKRMSKNNKIDFLNEYLNPDSDVKGFLISKII